MSVAKIFNKSKYNISDFVYKPTNKRFAVVKAEGSAALSFTVTGELCGIAVISGPRSTWVNVVIGEQNFRKWRVFDRNSYYDRYMIIPCFVQLRHAKSLIVCDQGPLDYSIAIKENRDFAMPRQLALVEFLGRDLVVALDE